MSKKEDKCRFMIRTKKEDVADDYLFYDSYMEAKDNFDIMVSKVVAQPKPYYKIILFYKYIDELYGDSYQWLSAFSTERIEIRKKFFKITYFSERNAVYYVFNNTNSEFEIDSIFEKSWIKEGIYYEKNNNG